MILINFSICADNIVSDYITLLEHVLDEENNGVISHNASYDMCGSVISLFYFNSRYGSDYLKAVLPPNDSSSLDFISSDISDDVRNIIYTTMSTYGDSIILEDETFEKIVVLLSNMIVTVITTISSHMLGVYETINIIGAIKETYISEPDWQVYVTVE